MSILDVPEWLTAKVELYMEAIGFGGWELEIVLALTPDDDPDCLACCQTWANLNFARITVRADIEDTPRWDKILLHELSHMLHGRIDHTVWDAIIAELPMEKQAMAHKIYSQAHESYVDYMSKVFQKLIHGEVSDEPILEGEPR